MSTPKISVALVVTGFRGTSADVTRILGVTPSRTWLAKEATSLPGIRRKEDGWLLSSPLTNTSALEPHLRWLLERLPTTAPPPETHEWSVAISCAITIIDEAPSITIPADLSRRIAALGAELDIDIIQKSE